MSNNSKSLRSGQRKGRGIKTTQISAPMPANVLSGAPVPPRPFIETPPPAPGSRPPPSRSKKTEDLVKRRYSTRFNNLPSFDGSEPPVPFLPPTSFTQAPVPRPPPSRDGGRDRERERRPPPSRGTSAAPPVLDPRDLREPMLNPDKYVAELFMDATGDQIRKFEDDLRKLKLQTTAESQKSVTQNRPIFIKISKEVQNVNTEMRALRNLMADLKANTTALRLASANRNEQRDLSGGLSTGMSKRDKRSSVIDRNALWNSQMQALYKNVEGSQKFLPVAASRHVVQNAGPWIELDNATYKSRRAMQVFLLNDHLLIASRKKRKVDGPNFDSRMPANKLVADRCWPLLEIEIVDMAGPGDPQSGRSKLADAIMVRGVGQESFIYRTEKAEDAEKVTLLLNIRKAVEELRKGLQLEREASNRAKETINYFASRDPGLLQKADLLETLSDVKDMLIEVDGNQQNLRWIEGQMDELDIDVALQRFEPAVALVEKLRGLARGLRNNVVAQDLIEFKVDERSGRLAAMVVRDLEATHNERTKTQRNIGWLARLGYEDRAREAYLGARSDMIQRLSRQCVFRGDLHMYIWQVSYVYFTAIHNTVQCFQLCFPAPMMSACVRWARDEVEAFNAILGRQLSGVKRGDPVWDECMGRAREHAKKLEEVGLDFRNVVGKHLVGAGEGGKGGEGEGKTGTGTASVRVGPGLGLSGARGEGSSGSSGSSGPSG